MLFAFNNRESFEQLEELASSQGQAKAVRLQDKLGKQNFQEDMKEMYEPLTDTIKNTSESITKNISETSIKNTKAISDLNEEVLELMNEKSLISPYLASSLVNLFKSENRSQFRMVKDLDSTKMNDFKKNGGIPVTLFSNMLTFRDSNISFKLDGDLLKTKTNYNFNADHSSPQDEKLNYEFAKEMNFDLKKIGRPSTRDRSVKRILDSPAIIASGISTIFSSGNPDEFCDRIKLLLQPKQAGNSSNVINEEVVAIVDKLLEYKCIFKKQHKQFLLKCNLLHE